MTDQVPDSEPSRGDPPWRIDVRRRFLLAILFAVIGVEVVGAVLFSRFGKGMPPLLREAIIQIAAPGAALLLFFLLPPRGGLAGKLGIRLPRIGDFGIALAGLMTIYAWQFVSLPLWAKLLHRANFAYEQHQALLTECSRASTPHFLALLALAGVLIPIAEEIFFRRVLFGLIRPIGELAAMLATSLIFAAAHFFLYGLPALFGLGLVFQLQYRHTGNLLTPMLTHMAYNLISLTLVFMLGL